MTTTFKRFALVYQCGIANVFGFVNDNRVRVFQHSYSACEWFCHGAMTAGADVSVYHADVTGDCADAEWVLGPGDLFENAKHAPFQAHNSVG